MSCKPQDRYIVLSEIYRIQVIVEGGQQRYIPLLWVDEPGFYESLLPADKVRLSVREARNDCALHAGKVTIG